MLKNFSTDALKAARRELDDVSVSHIETLIRAGMPMLKELLDEEIGGRDEPKQGAVGPLKK